MKGLDGPRSPSHKPDPGGQTGSGTVEATRKDGRAASHPATSVDFTVQARRRPAPRKIAPRSAKKTKNTGGSLVLWRSPDVRGRATAQIGMRARTDDFFAVALTMTSNAPIREREEDEMR